MKAAGCTVQPLTGVRMPAPGRACSLPGTQPHARARMSGDATAMTSAFRPSFPAALALALLLACLGCAEKRADMPVARLGVLDLSGWDPARDGADALNGQWEFYENRLLTPEDFRSGEPPRPTGYVQVPGKLNNAVVGDRKLGRSGYATLRLRVDFGRPTTGLGLRILDVRSAYALWVDGRPLVKNGVVGTDAPSELRDRSDLLVPLGGTDRTVEIILQVSNFSMPVWGVLYPIELDDHADLVRLETHRRTILAFSTGAMFIIGVYHIVLFFFRKKYIPPLLFGIYCLAWATFCMGSSGNGMLLRSLVSGLHPVFVAKTVWISASIASCLAYWYFYSLFPKDFSLLVLRLSQAFTVVFTALAAGASSHGLRDFVLALLAWVLVLNFCKLFMLFRASRRGRYGATVFLVVYAFLTTMQINDTLNDIGLIQTVLTVHQGMFLFIFYQAFDLARRSSQAFSSVEDLSVELESKNSALEEEIAQRKDLSRKIVQISDAERRRLSHNLHDGLCQLATGARLRCQTVEERVHSGRAVGRHVVELSTLLDDLVTQAYELSRGLWPVECSARKGLSLEELAQRASDSSGIEIAISQELGCSPCVNEHLVELYRIAQEALANAVKHSQAGRIVIRMACDGEGTLTLSVRDDGIGRGAAKPSRGGLGMGIMEHRASVIGGVLRVEDAPGGGTIVTCGVTCGVRSGKAAAPGGNG